jgi:Carboxypeptidase regulatory-like domain
MKFISSTFPVIVLLCATVFGQAAAPAPQPRTFHVKGTITDRLEAVVSGANVRFSNNQFRKVVSANEVGVYEADLPLGVYRVSADRLGLKTFGRPLVRASSPTTLIVNVTTYPTRTSCDILVSNSSGALPTRGQWEEASKTLCGGEDSFPVPSGDGESLALYIQFQKRRATDGGYVYSGDKLTTGDSLTPVFVEYNLLSLRADEIIYDMKERTIKANGNVVATDESGATRRADSLTFRIENGQATPLL